MSEDVLLRTKAGRIHKAVVRDSQRFSSEACNLDSAPGQEVIVDEIEIADAPVEAYCSRCFPEYAKGDER